MQVPDLTQINSDASQEGIYGLPRQCSILSAQQKVLLIIFESAADIQQNSAGLQNDAHQHKTCEHVSPRMAPG